MRIMCDRHTHANANSPPTWVPTEAGDNLTYIRYCTCVSGWTIKRQSDAAYSEVLVLQVSPILKTLPCLLFCLRTIALRIPPPILDEAKTHVYNLQEHGNAVTNEETRDSRLVFRRFPGEEEVWSYHVTGCEGCELHSLDDCAFAMP